MYYIKVSDDGNNLKLYCRNCEYTETEVTNLCIHSSDEYIDTEETYINRFTKLDPTLPRIQKMPCPNKECQTNISSEPVEIILIRYDNKNLKYLYLCSVCDYSWKTDIKN
jgi:hypothetical protein